MSTQITTTVNTIAGPVIVVGKLGTVGELAGAIKDQRGLVYAFFKKGDEEQLSPFVPTQGIEIFGVPDDSCAESDKYIIDLLYTLSLIINICTERGQVPSHTSTQLYNRFVADDKIDEAIDGEYYDKSFLEECESFLIDLKTSTPVALNGDYGGFGYGISQFATNLFDELGISEFLHSHQDEDRTSIIPCMLISLYSDKFKPIDIEFIPLSHIEAETWNIEEYDGCESLSLNDEQLSLFTDAKEASESAGKAKKEIKEAREKITELEERLAKLEKQVVETTTIVHSFDVDPFDCREALVVLYPKKVGR